MPRRTSACWLPLFVFLLAGCAPVVASPAPPVPTSAAPASPTPPSTPWVTPVRNCSSPEFATSEPDGGWSNGGYYVHNNMWNTDEAGPETLRACAYDNWYVDSSQPPTKSVKTYPNVHKDISGRFDDFTVINSRFAGRGPGTGIYDVAYDVWLNGLGNGPGVSELMVWTENHGQTPAGSRVATYEEYDVWRDDGYVAFVSRKPRYAGTVDLKELIGWAIGQGYVPKNPTLNQIGYGIEFCSTGGTKARFTLTDFAVTLR